MIKKILLKICQCILFLATIIAMIFGLKFLNTDETEKEEEIKEKIKENNKKIQEIETKVNETNKQIDKNLEHEQELSIKQNEIQTSIDVKYKDIDKQNKEFENQEQQIIDSSKNVDSNIDYLNSKYEWMKMKYLHFIFNTLLFICILSTSVMAAPVAYKLNTEYVAVRTDVFNKLTENDKMVDQLRTEIEYYKKTLQELKTLENQKDEIQNERISVLKDTMILKDQVISYKDQQMDYKDNQIDNYQQLYQIKDKELSRLKTKNWFEKILLVALGGYAISELDDNTAKAVIGSGIVFLVTN